jgi:hypothetical protein
MSDNKLQRWVGPELTELAPLENSISSELSYDGITYTQLKGTDVRDILAEDRDVVVKGLVLTSKQRATILESLHFAGNTESCDIALCDIDDAMRGMMYSSEVAR